MKRLILSAGVLLVVAGVAATGAQAVDRGPGGYIYWNTVTGSGGGIAKFLLYRLQIDNASSAVGAPVNFDNVVQNNTYTSWSTVIKNRNVEVYDPRISGGAGTLLLTAITNNTPPSRGYTAANYEQPWDVLQINPTTLSHTLLCDGRLDCGTWDSKHLYTALAAPKDWLPGSSSNNLSLVTVRGIWSSNVSYLFDANNNTVIDNTTAEGRMYARSAAPNGDAEFGPDKALYLSWCAGNPGVARMDRLWLKSTGVQTSNYFNIDNALDLIGLSRQTSAVGLAVGPGNAFCSRPIVYLFAMDNNFAGSITKPAIFALQDVNGDNVVTYGSGDVIKEIWRSGQAGITMSRELDYDSQDIELYVDPDNAARRTLFFNEYNGGRLYALSLVDNGLAMKGTGKTILTGGLPVVLGQGFEIDMNPAARIPEPATLLLLGTGALGALGWMRRRRMR